MTYACAALCARLAASLGAVRSAMEEVGGDTAARTAKQCGLAEASLGPLQQLVMGGLAGVLADFKVGGCGAVAGGPCAYDHVRRCECQKDLNA